MQSGTAMRKEVGFREGEVAVVKVAYINLHKIKHFTKVLVF